ncbi:unnamed protein product [Arabis nemorensis]|uniref:Myb/SANT-like domain-containing protein n=1 Tax=Arabis nemorensis TaxID=586526 RepID=A0A565AU99_9BRAS|nr:unnamed protein product [Arabis nemorensis]
MGDSQQAMEKVYNSWSPQETKTLINLLLDGVAAGWRDANGTFSNLTVEKRILPVINQTHGCVKTHKHYTNKMKTLKEKYLSGVEILRFSSGFGWDPITKRFTASDEVWTDYMKAHPNYKTFRKETFEEFDDLKVIFGNNIATGGNAIGLGEGTDARTSEAQKEQTNCVEDFSMNVENDHESS